MYKGKNNILWAGLNIRHEREGIVIITDRRGRATGEAYVQFETELDARKALDRNREKIGHRWVGNLFLL